MAGRKPLSPEIHKLRGTWRPDRHDNVWTPVKGEINPPEWMKPEAMGCFEYLRDTIKGIGCESSTFSAAVGALAELLYERNRLRDIAEKLGGPVIVRKLVSKGHEDDDGIKKNPAYQLFIEQDKRLASMLTEFGLTPAAMSRIKGLAKPEKNEEDDPYAKLLDMDEHLVKSA